MREIVTRANLHGRAVAPREKFKVAIVAIAVAIKPKAAIRPKWDLVSMISLRGV
jgi:hypothetical protein